MSNALTQSTDQLSSTSTSAGSGSTSGTSGGASGALKSSLRDKSFAEGAAWLQPGGGTVQKKSGGIQGIGIAALTVQLLEAGPGPDGPDGPDSPGDAAAIREQIQEGAFVAALLTLTEAPAERFVDFVRELDDGAILALLRGLSFDEKWNTYPHLVGRVLAARSPERNAEDALAILGLATWYADKPKKSKAGKNKGKGDGRALTPEQAYAAFRFIKALPPAHRERFEETHPELVAKMHMALNASMREADDTNFFGGGEEADATVEALWARLDEPALWDDAARARELEMTLGALMKAGQRALLRERIAKQAAVIFVSAHQRTAVERAFGITQGADEIPDAGAWLLLIAAAGKLDTGGGTLNHWKSGTFSALTQANQAQRAEVKAEKKAAKQAGEDFDPKAHEKQNWFKQITTKGEVSIENLPLDQAQKLIDGQAGGADLAFEDHGKRDKVSADKTNLADLGFDRNAGTLRFACPKLVLTRLHFPMGGRTVDSGRAAMSDVVISATFPTPQNPGQAQSLHVEAGAITIDEVFVTTPEAVIGIGHIEAGDFELGLAEAALGLGEDPDVQAALGLVMRHNPSRNLLSGLIQMKLGKPGDNSGGELQQSFGNLAAAFKSIPPGALGHFGVRVASLEVSGVIANATSYVDELAVENLVVDLDSQPSVVGERRLGQLGTDKVAIASELKALGAAEDPSSLARRTQLEARLARLDDEAATIGAKLPRWRELEALAQDLYELQRAGAEALRDEKAQAAIRARAGALGLDQALELPALAQAVGEELAAGQAIVASADLVSVKGAKHGDQAIDDATATGVEAFVKDDQVAVTSDTLDVGHAKVVGQEMSDVHATQVGADLVTTDGDPYTDKHGDEHAVKKTNAHLDVGTLSGALGQDGAHALDVKSLALHLGQKTETATGEDGESRTLANALALEVKTGELSHTGADGKTTHGSSSSLNVTGATDEKTHAALTVSDLSHDPGGPLAGDLCTDALKLTSDDLPSLNALAAGEIEGPVTFDLDVGPITLPAIDYASPSLRIVAASAGVPDGVTGRATVTLARGADGGVAPVGIDIEHLAAKTITASALEVTLPIEGAPVTIALPTAEMKGLALTGVHLDGMTPEALQAATGRLDIASLQVALSDRLAYGLKADGKLALSAIFVERFEDGPVKFGLELSLAKLGLDEKSAVDLAAKKSLVAQILARGGRISHGGKLGVSGSYDAKTSELSVATTLSDLGLEKIHYDGAGTSLDVASASLFGLTLKARGKVDASGRLTGLRIDAFDIDKLVGKGIAYTGTSSTEVIEDGNKVKHEDERTITLDEGVLRGVKIEGISSLIAGPGADLAIAVAEGDVEGFEAALKRDGEQLLRVNASAHVERVHVAYVEGQGSQANNAEIQTWLEMKRALEQERLRDPARESEITMQIEHIDALLAKTDHVAIDVGAFQGELGAKVGDRQLTPGGPEVSAEDARGEDVHVASYDQTAPGSRAALEAERKRLAELLATTPEAHVPLALSRAQIEAQLAAIDQQLQALAPVQHVTAASVGCQGIDFAQGLTFDGNGRVSALGRSTLEGVELIHGPDGTHVEVAHATADLSEADYHAAGFMQGGQAPAPENRSRLVWSLDVLRDLAGTIDLVHGNGERAVAIQINDGVAVPNEISSAATEVAAAVEAALNARPELSTPPGPVAFAELEDTLIPAYGKALRPVLTGLQWHKIFVAEAAGWLNVTPLWEEGVDEELDPTQAEVVTIHSVKEGTTTTESRFPEEERTRAHATVLARQLNRLVWDGRLTAGGSIRAVRQDDRKEVVSAGLDAAIGLGGSLDAGLTAAIECNVRNFVHDDGAVSVGFQHAAISSTNTTTLDQTWGETPDGRSQLDDAHLNARGNLGVELWGLSFRLKTPDPEAARRELGESTVVGFHGSVVRALPRAN